MAAGGFRVLAVAPLAAGGVTVKLLTVDNEFVRRKICQELAIDVGQVFVGDDIDRLDDAALTEAVGPAMLMVRLTPNQKRRVIETLRRKGHVVGFLGDGVNDALALREADVGISFDSAVDLTRKSADCILLDKDLGVLLDGIREGRRVFVNVLKYICMGASSNFGTMFNVLAASVILPFVPMAPVQLHVIRTDRIPFLQSRASLPLFGRDDGGAGGNLVAGFTAGGWGVSSDSCRCRLPTGRCWR